MTPERWRQVEEIAHAARSRVESERVPFLVHACAGDEALRREVESLLAHQASARGSLSGPDVASDGSSVIVANQEFHGDIVMFDVSR